MSPDARSDSRSEACNHENLCFTPSTYASLAGYHRPTARQRAAAARATKLFEDASAGETKKRKRDANDDHSDARASTFPAPLVLPGDDIATDPDYPPQSFQDWLLEEDRNEVTADRNVIYLAAPPDVESDAEFIRDWTEPKLDPKPDHTDRVAATPQVQDIADYMTAFYHPLTVRLLPPFQFIRWESSHGTKASSNSTTRTKPKKKPTTPSHIGLSTTTECIRIRTRGTPDNLFPRQLNLDDLLDAGMSSLPEDAYALLLLVHHDLFEDADDEFVCGRAYGGSRVAVVSMVRYNPILDVVQNVEREHAWPASHCKTYMDACCTFASSPQATVRTKSKKPKNALPVPDPLPHQPKAPTSPLAAAVSAYNVLPHSPMALKSLYLSRVCKTATHELGHCFGLDHCMYYACIMQGTASLTEDSRQPPYLCPVDLAKVLRATGADVEERYTALLEFCKRHEDVHMFAAFGAWIGTRLGEMTKSKV